MSGYRLKRTRLVDEPYLSAPTPCAHCGRLCGLDDAGGYASVRGQPVCHPPSGGRPDCYRVITIWHHQVTKCKLCSWPDEEKK